MLNKLFFGVAVVAVVIMAIGTFSGGKALFGSQTVNYSNSGGSANLYNSLASIVQDVTAVRNAAGGSGIATTTTWNPPSISSTTIATTSVTLTCTAGDPVIANLSSATGSVSGLAPQIYGECVGSNSIMITEGFPLGSGATLGANTVDNVTGTLTVFTEPVASLLQPAALNTVTSTSN